MTLLSSFTDVGVICGDKKKREPNQDEQSLNCKIAVC